MKMKKKNTTLSIPSSGAQIQNASSMQNQQSSQQQQFNYKSNHIKIGSGQDADANNINFYGGNQMMPQQIYGQQQNAQGALRLNTKSPGRGGGAPSGN